MKKIVLVVSFLFLVVGSGWTENLIIGTSQTTGKAYEDLMLQTGIPISGYNGVIDIYPRTIPGSGTAQHLTYFKNNPNGSINAATLHNVCFDNKVGIGTTQPSTLLELSKASNESFLRFNNATNKWDIAFDAGSLKFKHDNSNKDVLFLQKNSGNVGIGTTNPKAKLEVSDGNVYLYTTSIGRSGGHYQEVGYNIGFTNSKDIYTYRIDDTAASIRFGHNGGIEFRTAPFGDQNSPLTLANKMTLTESGNIGIGTTNPQNKLDVNGTIHAKEIIVDENFTASNVTLTNTGWADYVFEDDYKLQPLSEIESFVKENKHLPEVPSAEEIKNDGLSMASMMELQMKKIEELTLHLIEQNKQNSKQADQIAFLLKKIETIESN